MTNLKTLHQCTSATWQQEISSHTKKVREFSGKKSGEWTISKKNPRLFKKSTITRQKNKTGDRKEESNDSPESSDNEDIRQSSE